MKQYSLYFKQSGKWTRFTISGSPVPSFRRDRAIQFYQSYMLFLSTSSTIQFKLMEVK